MDITVVVIVVVVAAIVAFLVGRVSNVSPQPEPQPEPRKLGLKALEDLVTGGVDLDKITVRNLMVTAAYLGHDTPVAAEIDAETSQNVRDVTAHQKYIEELAKKQEAARASIADKKTRNAALANLSALMPAPPATTCASDAPPQQADS